MINDSMMLEVRKLIVIITAAFSMAAAAVVVDHGRTGGSWPMHAPAIPEVGSFHLLMVSRCFNRKIFAKEPTFLK